jgi:hypothetical protein
LPQRNLRSASQRHFGLARRRRKKQQTEISI